MTFNFSGDSLLLLQGKSTDFCILWTYSRFGSPRSNSSFRWWVRPNLGTHSFSIAFRWVANANVISVSSTTHSVSQESCLSLDRERATLRRPRWRIPHWSTLEQYRYLFWASTSVLAWIYSKRPGLRICCDLHSYCLYWDRRPWGWQVFQ